MTPPIPQPIISAFAEREPQVGDLVLIWDALLNYWIGPFSYSPKVETFWKALELKYWCLIPPAPLPAMAEETPA